MDKFVISVMLCLLTACVYNPEATITQKSPETLSIYEDGQMVLNDRVVNQEDVVIYPDGRGGERAAIKMRMPSKPDFYRDTIKVERVSSSFERPPEYNNQN